MADIVFPGQTASGTIGTALLPANYDLELYQGDDFDITVTVKDAGGTAINLTGATAKCSIRTDYSASTSYDATCTISAPTSGQVQISFPSTITSTLVAGDYIWDFQVTDSAGKKRTYLAGDVTVYGEVTK